MAVRKYLSALCCLLLLNCVFSDRKTLDLIYKDIDSFSPCVRRFNRNGQTGCSSDMNGNTGVVHYIQEYEDLDWLLHTGPHEPYMPILTPHMFTLEVINALMNSSKINGMMVIHTHVENQVMNETFSFSPDQACPNKGYGYGACDMKWNVAGTNLVAHDFNIPIFSLLDEKEVESILKCYFDKNIPDKGKAREYPLCAVELMDFMHGAVDTETCMRRTHQPTNIEEVRYCDPLSDSNVYGTLTGTNKTNPHKQESVIIAAAPLDSTSLFYDVTPEPGVELAATSFITLLSAAYALGRLNTAQRNSLSKTIMFEFFHGESYDYIGSSRTVFDMLRGQYPVKMNKAKEQPALVNLTNIAMFLELRQLGLPDNEKYYAHHDKTPSSKTSEFINNLKIGFESTEVKLEKAPDGQGLPPASFQSFLREDNTIPGVVISDHQREYNNRFYNSRFEVAALLGLNFTDGQEETEGVLTDNLNNVATGIAKALYLEAGGSTSDEAYNLTTANHSITGELIYCFLYKPTCRLFQSVLDEEDSNVLSDVPYQFYIGVHRTTSNYVKLVHNLLSYFIALDIKNIDKEDKDKCKNDDENEMYSFSYMQGPNLNGICVQSATGYTIAVSPAFVEDVEDFPQWSSEKYSTWTESVWNAYTARLFLKPSREQESLIFSIGMVIMLISFPLIYFLNAKGSTIFNRE
ncbi:nicastrin-like [Antedon mediterranea]|uniref:nicastrin-like n=1 Tax=Antedon mediterranea TaxID=105859 RepID=UPI003AF5C286